MRHCCSLRAWLSPGGVASPSGVPVDCCGEDSPPRGPPLLAVRPLRTEGAEREAPVILRQNHWVIFTEELFASDPEVVAVIGASAEWHWAPLKPSGR